MNVSAWLKQRFFFRVDPKDKAYVRKTLMNTDHRIFSIMMLFIAFLQIVMLIYTLATNGLNISSYEPKRLAYLICYIFLASAMLGIRPILAHYKNRDRQDAYFVCVAVAVDCFYAWATAISVLDSLSSPELTTYSYVVLALTAFVILDPWVYMVNVVGFSAVLVSFIAIFGGRFSSFVIISSISIALLTTIAATFNFNRRVNALFLERQVKTLNDELKGMAYRDELTNTYNRRYLTEHIATAMKFGNKPSAVIMFDIDDFKMVNDTYGHPTGDAVLSKIGAQINDFLLKTPGYAVRYGGEEFLIFVESAPENDVYNKCEELRKGISALSIAVPDSDPINVTVSIGIASAKRGMTYEDLINVADNRLYKAKDAGKDRCVNKD